MVWWRFLFLNVGALLASAAFACKPPQDYKRPSAEEMFSKAAVVAWVRVTHKQFPITEGLYRRAAQVQVIESFKGPANFELVFTSSGTCGIPMAISDELVLFMDERFLAAEAAYEALFREEIANSLPTLRRLKSAR